MCVSTAESSTTKRYGLYPVKRKKVDMVKCQNLTVYSSNHQLQKSKILYP